MSSLKSARLRELLKHLPSVNKEGDCLHYLKPEYLDAMPYLYQLTELKAYPLSNEEWNHYLSQVSICPSIQKQFLEKANAAKKEIIDKLMKQPIVQGFDEPLRHYYETISIHSKQEFLNTLRKGFDWIRPRLGKWVLVTENYVEMVRNPEFKKFSSIPFKSSEWIGKLFLSTLNERRKCQCVVDSLYIENVIHKPEHSCYVMFDDGAYSGCQKGNILKSFIETVLPVRQDTTFYLVIPYYTVYALEHFRKSIQDAVKFVRNSTTDTDCSYEMDDQTHEYTLTMERNDRETKMTILIWTGGVQMEESEHIIRRLDSDPETRKAFLIAISQTNSLGATMTMFEHKIPDYLSFNFEFGNEIETKMKDHYSVNPPYKVKNRKTTGGRRPNGNRTRPKNS